MENSIVPVLMCGGFGTRLWPLSTTDRPKAFHAIHGELSLFQATVRRLAPGPGSPFTAPVIVCGSGHVDLVRAQMREIGMRPALVVIEPQGRGTCAAAAAAAIAAHEVEPGAPMLLSPIDHFFDDDIALRRVVVDAAHIAADRIVLFAAEPDRPETGYGYIQVGERLDDVAHRVTRFLEKPDVEVARELVASGWRWNTGLFLCGVDRLATEIARAAPDVWSAVSRAWVKGERFGQDHLLRSEELETLPVLSFDRAVVERSHALAAVDGVTGWRDIGAWNAIWQDGQRDMAQNMLRGAGSAVDANSNLLWNVNRSVPVTMFGVEGLAVIATEREILIMPLDRSQEVGRFAR